MESLEAERERAEALEVGELADAIESIGFECTRCGACCKAETACGEATEDAGDGAADGEAHTATVFPGEVRELLAAFDSRGHSVLSLVKGPKCRRCGGHPRCVLSCGCRPSSRITPSEDSRRVQVVP